MGLGLGRVGIGILAFLCVSFSVWGQSEVGLTAINGTVSDPSGAVIAEAAVILRSQDTGLRRETKTTEAGFYTVPSLPPGAYELTVTREGFATAVRKDIRLTVGSASTLNIQLVLGSTSQVADVTATVDLVETSRTAATTTVGQRQILELPVNGRNFLDFTLLTPGVVRDPTRSGDISFGGQRGTSNSLLVDGADSNNTFYGQSTGRTGTGRNPYSFSEDAVQEFRSTLIAMLPKSGAQAAASSTRSRSQERTSFTGTSSSFSVIKR